MWLPGPSVVYCSLSWPHSARSWQQQRVSVSKSVSNTYTYINMTGDCGRSNTSRYNYTLRLQYRDYTMFSISNSWHKHRPDVLLRCMECRRDLVMRILSVCLSVCLCVCQTRDLRQNKRNSCPDIYRLTVRKII